MSRPGLIAAALLLVACHDGGRLWPDARPPEVDAAAPGSDAPPPEPQLRVDYLDPDHGPFAGGTEVALRGRGFAPGMTVALGGRQVPALDVEVIDERRAVLVTPPGLPGSADLEVAVAGRTAAAPGAFRYEAILVDPPSGAVAGGTFVRVKGLGTGFQDGDVVTVGGSPLASATIVSEQEIAGYTPPGNPGAVDVVVSGPGGTVAAQDAYTYADNSDPFAGGLAGGPIAGSLDVTVMDAWTGNGVDGAYVVLGDPLDSPWQGHADAFGEITFSGPDLAGPVTLTAAQQDYETTTIVRFDARYATIFLTPHLPPPEPGPLPPGRGPGVVNGHILFGSATGIGTPDWGLVPPPRRPTERRRAYVTTSHASVFSGNPPPGDGGTVDWEAGRTAWPFSITARPAALAVVAVAGLYDTATAQFEPFAVGAARGVLVGAEQVTDGVDVVIDVPLDTAVRVDLEGPPPLGVAGFPGPTEHQARVYVDLGGEGVIALPGNRAVFAPGATSTVLGRMAPLVGSIGDGSYTLITGAWTGSGGSPYSVRVLHGVRDLSAPVVVTDFLGTPRAVDPPAGGVASRAHLAFQPDPGPVGAPTFTLSILYSSEGDPLWRVIARGGEWDVPLHDLRSVGLPPLPADPITWYLYEITVPGLSFDAWTYRHNGASYWSAYAFSYASVQFPPP